MLTRCFSNALTGLTILLLMAGCSTSPPVVEQDGLSYRIPPPADLDSIPDAIPKEEPLSRYGNPPSYRVFGREYNTLKDHKGYKERGIASWYGSKFHGRRTSSGEPYDMYAMTAAHKTLPLPVYARVTNLRNGRSVVLKINDRGPFHDNRLIDLSYTAAWKLGISTEGTGLVEVEVIDASAPDPDPELERQSLALTQGGSKGLPALFLQVGAFGNQQNAQRLRSRLENELKTGVLIHQNAGNETPVYRVQVGPIASVELCDLLADRLNLLGIAESRLVIRQPEAAQVLSADSVGVGLR